MSTPPQTQNSAFIILRLGYPVKTNTPDLAWPEQRLPQRDKELIYDVTCEFLFSEEVIFVNLKSPTVLIVGDTWHRV